MFNVPIQEVPVPTIEDAGLSECKDLLSQREYYKTLKKELEENIANLDESIGKIFDQKDIKSAVWKNYLVIRRAGSKPRPSLDRVLLMEAGVTPQQLKAGTKFSEAGKPGITVRSLSEAKTQGYEEYPTE